MKSTGAVKKTTEGLEFTLPGPGKISYKDKEIEGEMDTRSTSLLRTVIESAVVQGMQSK